jgi:fibronectin-binding autotransporter adhesin
MANYPCRLAAAPHVRHGICWVLFVLSMLACRIGLGGTITKANNTNALDQGSSWVGGVVPTSTDVIRWDSTVTAANTTVLGSNLAVQGIQIVNPGGLITIGDNTLVLSLGAAGIDMTTATRNLMITAAVDLTAAQTWNVASGRFLDSNNNFNNGGITVNTNGHTLTVQGAGEADLGTVTGSGGLVKNGTGTLRLQSGGSWTYTGDVTINAGAVRVGNAAGALGSGASQLFLNGGTLTFVSNFGSNNYGRNTTIGGDVGFVNSSSTGTGSQNYGFGTLAIGQHTVGVTANGTGTISFGATTLTGSPTFDVGSREGNALQLGAIGESGGARSITKTGIGTLRLTGASTYTGTTTISEGILELTGAGSLPTAGAVVNDATLSVSGITASGLTIGSLAGSGTVALGGKTLTVGNASDTSYGGEIDGVGGSLVKQGSGALTLSGANSFDGTLAVAAGTVAIPTINDAGVAGPLGAGSAAVLLGGAGSTGTLSYTGPKAASTRPFQAVAGTPRGTQPPTVW